MFGRLKQGKERYGRLGVCVYVYSSVKDSSWLVTSNDIEKHISQGSSGVAHVVEKNIIDNKKNLRRHMVLSPFSFFVCSLPCKYKNNKERIVKKFSGDAAA